LIELSPLSSKMKQRVLALLQQPVDPQVMQAKGLVLQKTAADITEKQAAAQRHRSQSVMGAARAAHLVSEAYLNGAQAFKTAVEAATGPHRTMRHRRRRVIKYRDRSRRRPARRCRPISRSADEPRRVVKTRRKTLRGCAVRTALPLARRFHLRIF
jgi:hypothetical protein